MRDARGRDRTCQEVTGSHPAEIARADDRLIRCGEPAGVVVDLGDNQPYWMCDQHASHSIRNRGGVRLVPVGWAPEDPLTL